MTVLVRSLLMSLPALAMTQGGAVGVRKLACVGIDRRVAEASFRTPRVACSLSARRYARPLDVRGRDACATGSMGLGSVVFRCEVLR